MKKLIVLATIFLSACGGGSDSGSSPSDTGNTVTKQDALVVGTPTAAKEIASISTVTDGSATMTTVADSAIGNNLTAGSVVTVLSGADNRYPLGLSARVQDVTPNADGSKTVTLQAVTLADVAQSVNRNVTVGLNADNFIGVISPSATKAALGSKVPALMMSGFGGKTALNGGITVRNSRTVSALSAATRPAAVQLGDIDLNLTIKLKDMGIDASRMKPFGANADAEFNIAGSIKNLQLTENINFSLTSGLKSLDLRVDGDMQIESKLSGSGSVEFGYYSQAWKEVEDAQLKMLGITGKLTGLESKDKVGKFPVAGLVWSTKCPGTCPVAIGATQTPLRAASEGGVIIWVYLTSKGTITLEGSMGARVNPAKFTLGMTMPEGGQLSTINNLTNSGTGRLIEAPFVDGNLTINSRHGISLDADIFTLGVRIANGSLDVVNDSNTEIKGAVSYGTTKLGDPWEWQGNVCLNTTLGAGLIFSASINAGVEINTAWSNVAVGAGYKYAGQWPSEDVIRTPGWHGIADKTWFTDIAKVQCFPKLACAPADEIVTGSGSSACGVSISDALVLMDLGWDSASIYNNRIRVDFSKLRFNTTLSSLADKWTIIASYYQGFSPPGIPNTSPKIVQEIPVLDGGTGIQEILLKNGREWTVQVIPNSSKVGNIYTVGTDGVQSEGSMAKIAIPGLPQTQVVVNSISLRQDSIGGPMLGSFTITSGSPLKSLQVAVSAANGPTESCIMNFPLSQGRHDFSFNGDWGPGNCSLLLPAPGATQPLSVTFMATDIYEHWAKECTTSGGPGTCTQPRSYFNFQR